MHSDFGALKGSEEMTLSFEFTRKILRAFPKSSRSTLNACNTQSPAVMAFVVAIAGMILPASSAECQHVE